jgi:oligoribonuclease
MIDLKHSPSTKLLWLDLEMTGLDAQVDRILEVATVATDFDFKELARYEAQVKHGKDEVVKLMQANPFWATVPQSRDDILAKLDHAKPSEQVEQELITLIKNQFGDEPVVLAGNSIYFDRQFIKQWWPKLDGLLHYRMLDVSSYKILMQSKYGVEYTKKEAHRALGDIEESIAELKFYLDYFKAGSEASSGP